MGSHKTYPTVSQIHGRNAALSSALKTKSNLLKVPGRTHVMIAIPCVKASITIKIATLLCDCICEGIKPGGKFIYSFKFVNDYHPTEYARNVLCRHFLDSDAEYLWFIDSDTMPSDDSLKLMDAVGADIFAGVYPIGRQDKGNRVLAVDWGMYKKVENSDYGHVSLPLEAYQKDEIIDVDAAATGCMVISRKVIEHFAKDAEKDEDGTPAIFKWPKKCTGKSATSDDFDFCMRAKEVGFNIKVHTGVRWGHLKLKDLQDVYEQLKSAWKAGYEESMEDGATDALNRGMGVEDGDSEYLSADRA